MRIHQAMISLPPVVSVCTPAPGPIALYLCACSFSTQLDRNFSVRLVGLEPQQCTSLLRRALQQTLNLTLNRNTLPNCSFKDLSGAWVPTDICPGTMSWVCPWCTQFCINSLLQHECCKDQDHVGWRQQHTHAPEVSFSSFHFCPLFN